MIDSRTAPYAAFVLRIALGVMFIAHALLKVFVFTIPGTVGFFGSIGLPAFLAYLTIFGELIGGAAILLGIWTRVASFALVPILLGALWVHSGNGWLFTAKGGGWEYPAFLALAAIAQGLLGDGAFALGKIFKGQAGAKLQAA
jgi:putative oxidoreductase